MVSLGLEEKVIVVTGGNRGIGAAIVSLLIELGAKVAYTDLVTDNPQGLGIVADVTKLESMEAAAQQIEAELGPVYGIVANAGITRDNFFAKLTPLDWDLVINVNLKGVNHTIKPFIEGMYERQAGSIVCISSISAIKSPPKFPVVASVNPQISPGQLPIYSLLLPAVMSLEKSSELMGPTTPNQLSVISYQWVS